MRKYFKKSVVVGAIFWSRFGILPPNVAAVGSFGFFGGGISGLVGLIGLTFGFDYFFGGFYSGFIWTYLGFLSYWILGRFARKSWRKAGVLLPLASFSFFVISNFGVWLYWYPQTLEGLLACYAAAIPFYRNTLFGDVLFGYGFLAYRHILKPFFEKTAQDLQSEKVATT